MRPGNAHLAAVVAIWATFAACTHSQAWQASGESIDALGRTFLATAQIVDAAYDAKRLPEADYARWREFALYFKSVHRIAADRWLHGDDTASEHAAAVLAALSAELAVWSARGAK
jgi:hypothetical protein